MSKPTAFGQRVLDSANNGIRYGTDWLRQQMEQAMQPTNQPQVPALQDNQQAIADALRRKQGYGYLGMFSGDRVLMPAGQSLIKDSNLQMQQYLEDQQSQENRRVLENWYKAQDATDRAQLDETRRGNDLDFLASMYRTDAMGQQQQNKMRNMPAGIITDLQEFGQIGNALEELGQKTPYKKDWETLPGVRPLRNWVARNAPMLSPNSDIEAAEWMRKFQDMYALVDRHKLFGSAYTQAEHEAYRQATINGNLTADQIQTFFDHVSQEWNQQYEQKIAGMDAENFRPDSTRGFVGRGPISGRKPGTPQDEPTDDPATVDDSYEWQDEDGVWHSNEN